MNGPFQTAIRVINQPGVIVDRLVIGHLAPDGSDIIEHEMVEVTDFSTPFPSTLKTVRRHQVLACGHSIDLEQFRYAGRCQRKRIRRIFAVDVCNEEYCVVCGLQCAGCGLCVSTHCCAAAFDGKLLCKDCARICRMKKAVVGFLASVVLGGGTQGK